MTAETHAQQPDGTWQPAEPIPMQPGIDWEVYGSGEGPFRAEAFDGYTKVAEVTAKSRVMLNVRMALKHRRLTR